VPPRLLCLFPWNASHIPLFKAPLPISNNPLSSLLAHLEQTKMLQEGYRGEDARRAQDDQARVTHMPALALRPPRIPAPLAHSVLPPCFCRFGVQDFLMHTHTPKRTYKHKQLAKHAHMHIQRSDKVGILLTLSSRSL